MKIANFILLLMISTLITLIVYYQVQDVKIIEPVLIEPISVQETSKEKTVVTVTLTEPEVTTSTDDSKLYEPVFSVNKIDDVLYNRIKDLSYQSNDHISRLDLRYLKLSYWGFDGEHHEGEMIVHKAVADEVSEIFKELYEAKYLIEKIRLIDEYDADDNLSMLDNNSSAFNYRMVAGTKNLSNHAYGLAIDINPKQNPYVKNNFVVPDGSEEFTDRTLSEVGMIKINDVCYNAFISRGWTWGGEWKRVKDYQHFEKKIEGTN